MNKVKDISDEELKQEMKKRGLSRARIIEIELPELPDYCEKCGAPVDEEGKYKYE